MNNDTVNSLREALKFSPGNVPLKLHLADTLLGMNRNEEAEKEYTEIIAFENNEKAKLGLAKVYYSKNNYSTCIVLAEDILQASPENVEALILNARALLKENSIAAAFKVYQQVLKLNPLFADEELDGQLRIAPGAGKPGDDDDDINENAVFIERPDVNFNHVGGMDAVKKEIEMKIIHPLKHPEIYKAYGKKTGGGILLYGPPGCGKTHIARATAGQVNSRFISVGLNDILDMWIGSSEKNLHEIFQRARQNTPCVLFFDEIDALGASRSDMKQSAGRHLINQFLQELDGIDYKNDGILVLGATNTPWHLDPAFRRPGRFDRIIFVPPPDEEARIGILKIKLTGKPAENIDYAEVAKRTADFSGADIEALIDIAIESKLEDAIKSGIPEALKTKDLVNAAKKHKASTKEWFTIAKNFALYSNDSGLYDDILTFLKIKK